MAFALSEQDFDHAQMGQDSERAEGSERTSQVGMSAKFAR
jgi:hypothetical protein